LLEGLTKFLREKKKIFITKTRKYEITKKIIRIFARIHEMPGLVRAFHNPDRLWRKAFQPEAVVCYCEG
jgi:hypothetical protein